MPIQCIKSSFSMWWTMTGSNCRHPACKAGALPAELIVHVVGDPWGNRTPDTAVKGRCLNRLTNGPESGDSSAIRTRDTLIKSQVLCQLS